MAAKRGIVVIGKQRTIDAKQLLDVLLDIADDWTRPESISKLACSPDSFAAAIEDHGKSLPNGGKPSSQLRGSA